MIRSLLLSAIAICLLAGCDEPRCRNTNPVFDKYPLDSKEYNAELLRELSRQDSNELTYWVNRYISIDSRHYMEVNVHGDGLCTPMIFEIGSVKRLENFITIAGESYSGAEMTGVSYRVDSTDGRIRFMMTGLKRIID